MIKHLQKIGAVALLLLTAFSDSQAQGYRYGTVGIGGGGYVSGIITSKKQPGLLYARTDVGGAYRWDSVNAKWISLLDWTSSAQQSYQGVAAVALDAQVPQNVYMAVGNYGGTSAILRSNDYGATFAITNTTSQFKIYGNNIGRGNGEKLQVDPNNSNILFYGSNYNGLFKSVDAGATWARVAALPILATNNTNGISFVLFDSASGTPGTATPRMYVGVSTIDSTYNLYTSADGGASFTPLPLTGGPNPRASLPQRAVLAKDGNLFISLDDKCGPGQETSGFIYKYNTATGAWTNVSPASGIGLAGISVDPQNPQRLIASTANAYKAQYTSGSTIFYGDRYYLTNNGGSTWQTLVPVSGYNNNNLVLNPNGITWIYGQTLHWGGCIEFDPFNSNKAWVTSGNGIFTCNNLNSLANNNQVNTWNFVAHGIEETVPYDVVSIPGGPLFVGVADYDGFKITDVSQYTAVKYSPGTSKATGIAFATQNTNYLVRVGSIVAYSTNQGSTWTATATNKGTYGRVAVSADGTVILHCPSGATNTWRSTDNGATWTACTGIAGSIPWADPVNPNVFYVYGGGSSGTVYISTDYGVSFTSTGGSPGANGSTIIRTALGYPGHLWVAMNSGGLKFSADSGKTFSAIAGVTYCQAVGVGIANPAGTYASVYIWGTVGGVNGLFGSIDKGLTWTRLNDDAHQYGGIGNGNFVYADNNVVGRYYYGTLGRGIPYGEPLVALPVQLLRFSGSLSAKGEAVLSWRTVNESNSHHFEVERSGDGRTFTTVGTVATQAMNGNSTSPLEYSFTDANAVSGVVYYRLKQVDKNGKITYSNILTLRGTTGRNELMIYPNPAAGDNLTLAVQLTAPQKATVRITSLLGEVLYTGKPLSLLAGSNTVPLGGKVVLAKGMYVVELLNTGSGQLIGRGKVMVE